MSFLFRNMTSIVLLAGLSGCTSISSTMLTRDETNWHWEKHGHLKGIPITLNVPTHLKVYILEKHYLGLSTIGSEEIVEPVKLDIPVRDFSHELLYTDKIFTVDFKRPAAGSYNLRLDMTDKQYFDKIQHDVTDETIEKVANLVGSIVGAPSEVTPAGLPVGPRIKTLHSVVAVGVFELDSPDFEEQVVAFLNCHMNKSHDAWVVPPGMNQFNRVGIPESGNVEIPYPSVPLCPEGVDCYTVPGGPNVIFGDVQ